MQMVACSRKKTRVFLSHSEKDARVARQIGKSLRAAGFDVWSVAETYPGDNVALEIGRALESADAMVVIMSPDSARAANVQWEIGYALGSVRYKDKLIPVLVRATKDMPWILKEIGFIDAKRSPESAGAKVVKRLRRALESQEA